LTDDITVFEASVIAKLRFHREFTLETLTYIFGRSEAAMSRYVNAWIPKWAAVAAAEPNLQLTAA
jgi:hypothetical protein